MLSYKVAKFLLTFVGLSLLISEPTLVSSFHLDSNPVIFGAGGGGLRLRNNDANSVNSNSSSNSTLAKGNLSNLTTQIQSIIQPLLNSLNTTKINSTITSLLGTLNNLTSSFSGIKPKGSFRLENLIQNVTEVLRNSTESLQRNSSSLEEVESGIQNALKDFERRLTDTTRNLTESGGDQEAQRKSDGGSGRTRKTNGFRRMWDQMTTFRAQMDQSILNARSRLEDTMNTVTRQGPGVMRNQTVGIMNEVQRVFSVFTEPFRQFMQSMRKRLPTSVVNAK